MLANFSNAEIFVSRSPEGRLGAVSGRRAGNKADLIKKGLRPNLLVLTNPALV